MGDSELLDRFAGTNRSAAQRLLDAIRDIIVKIRRALSGGSQAMLTEDQKEAFRDLQGREEEMARLLEDALERTRERAAENENAATAGGEARYSIETVGGRLMTVIDAEPDTSTKKAANEYLNTLVNAENPFATVLAEAQAVYLGEDLPGEYIYSEDTRFSEYNNMQTKMQAATNLDEMLLLAENGEWKPRDKEKHKIKAANGWYRYDVEFAEEKKDGYQIYSGQLIVRNDADGKSYLYDLLHVKEKEKIPAPIPSQSGKLPGQKAGGTGIGLAPAHAPKESSLERSVSALGKKSKPQNGERRDSRKRGDMAQREARLLRENDLLRQQVDALRGELRRSDPAGRIDQKDVHRAAQKLLIFHRLFRCAQSAAGLRADPCRLSEVKGNRAAMR